MSTDELILLNCGAREDSRESLEWHQSYKKSTLNILERLMLKLQYFGHLMRRANSLEKILKLAEKTLIEGKREGPSEDNVVR